MTPVDDLRRLAEAAPRAPWHLVKASSLASGVNNEVGSVVPAIWKATAEYIAACSPDRILAILDRLDAAESQREALDVERLRKAIQSAEDRFSATVGFSDDYMAHVAAEYAALKEQP